MQGNVKKKKLQKLIRQMGMSRTVFIQWIVAAFRNDLTCIDYQIKTWASHGPDLWMAIHPFIGPEDVVHDRQRSTQFGCIIRSICGIQDLKKNGKSNRFTSILVMKKRAVMTHCNRLVYYYIFKIKYRDIFSPLNLVGKKKYSIKMFLTMVLVDYFFE